MMGGLCSDYRAELVGGLGEDIHLWAQKVGAALKQADIAQLRATGHACMQRNITNNNTNGTDNFDSANLPPTPHSVGGVQAVYSHFMSLGFEFKPSLGHSGCGCRGGQALDSSSHLVHATEGPTTAPSAHHASTHKNRNHDRVCLSL